MKNSKFIKSSILAVFAIAIVSSFLISSTTIEESNSKVIDKLTAELDYMKLEITKLKTNETDNRVSNDPYLAEVTLFAGAFAPRGWAFCHGQLLNISQNSALFSLIGTTYGGDGRTNFALPDLRSRSVVGEGRGPGLSQINLGEKGGVESMFLTASDLPKIAVSTQMAGFELDPKSTLSVYSKGNASFITVGNPSNTVIRDSKAYGGNTSGQRPMEKRSPYLGMNYIIAIQGVFPSRS